MRIYEVSEGRCIDYAKVSSISKHMKTDVARWDSSKQQFWIEFLMDSGQIIKSCYTTIEERDTHYDLFLKAWKSTTNDTDNDNIIFRSLD